jgi:Ca2+-binding EF-hand superfamily protein
MHCDLKEANVMVANKTDLNVPQVVVIDFGLANHLSSTSRGGGSPGYMPPEVWQDELWTPRGDVFSLGCIVFSLTFGASPFLEGCRTIQDVKTMTCQLEPTMDFGSASMRALVNSMIAKKYTDRPPIQSVVASEWFSEQVASSTHELNLSALEKLAQNSKQTALRRALLADVASRENLAQLTALNELFIQLDKDNDGILSAPEVKTALLQHNWKEEDINKLLKCLVGKGDEVSYEEFMVNLLASMANEESALVERIFREADSRGRGALSLDDIKELLKRPAIEKIVGKRDPADLLKLWKDMDRDGDGEVSLEEFSQVMHGVPRESSAEGTLPMHSILMTRTMKSVKAQPGRDRPTFKVGQQIEYYSASYAQWIPGTVEDFHPTFGVKVTNKPGWWIKGQELAKVRPAIL